MEVIEYEFPTKWDDKGMNWSNPDPRNGDYIMAIRQALMERAAAAHCSLPSDVIKISPLKTVSIKQVYTVLKAIKQICGNFFNKDFDDYEEDFSDFPMMWTYGDLIQERGCDVYNFAKTGDLLLDGGEWLKKVKNVIDKLTTIKCPQAWGYTRTREGSKHDPPFAESIGTAMSDAMDDEKGLKESKFTRVPSSIYAWSGNTHWKCPIPDWDDEDNVDGYCGYAKSISYRFEKIRSWLIDAEFDILGDSISDQCTGPVSYSQELATSVFDAGDCGWEKGLNAEEPHHVDDPDDVDWEFGYLDNIPKNEVVPVSDFDSEGVAQHRRSAKRGYEGKCAFFLDYGCENGFNFRSSEE